MIPKDCERLAEVDFPIAEVSKHAARGKSIRHRNRSTPHPWRTSKLTALSSEWPARRLSAIYTVSPSRGRWRELLAVVCGEQRCARARGRVRGGGSWQGLPGDRPELPADPTACGARWRARRRWQDLHHPPGMERPGGGGPRDRSEIGIFPWTRWSGGQMLETLFPTIGGGQQ